MIRMLLGVAPLGAVSAAPAWAQPTLDCRVRAMQAMNEGQLSIRTDQGAMLAVIAPAMWPADPAAREALVNELDCSMSNFGATGTFAVVEDGSDRVLAVKRAGQISYPQ
ncbi:MAG: hypothetical protein IT535_12785 [Bauldia sp.]|nr:hypothetical protein [Bauldia sp.]